MRDSHILRTEQCYMAIGQSSVIEQYFYENKSVLIFQNYFGFEVAKMPLELVLSEPLLESINRKYKIKSAGITKITPYRVYDWHVDINRGVSINLLLTPTCKSLVLFANEVKDSNDQLDFVELIYEPKTFYLINNQIKHCVINFNESRYLFTLEFELNKNVLNFDEVACLAQKVRAQS